MKGKQKGTKNLTYTQRLMIENCINAGLTKKQIAEKLNIGLTTVYRELHRGEYQHKVRTSTDYYGEAKYKLVTRYSPNVAEDKYRMNMTSKGAPLKVGKDFEFVKYVEKRILKDKLSPCAVVGEIKKNNLTRTIVSKTTIYRYIEIGIFSNVSLENLPLKQKKKKYRKTVAKRVSKGASIEQRPIEILNRNTFGHWEMDCVVGMRNKSDILLTLTERLTRFEIILKMSDRKTNTVVSSLNKIERKFGKKFRSVFKSITVDNGSEFSDYINLEKSIYKGNRIKIYYCHPYSSCERGSNERLNREIRRWIPKGTDIKSYSEEEVKAVETWVNNYPREIFDFDTSANKFQQELSKIG